MTCFYYFLNPFSRIKRAIDAGARDTEALQKG